MNLYLISAYFIGLSAIAISLGYSFKKYRKAIKTLNNNAKTSAE